MRGEAYGNRAMQIGVTVIRESGGAKDAYELRAADLFYVKQNDDRRAKLLCLLNIKHFYQTNKTHTVQY